ncbi:TetR/AcrR family transcriptional regulator [Streptomyces sp. ISL-36]|uniref:TetR/AcrR family transcriptional regulator n=1 Tax=Streptomyces sp. ISL-36 TaxID=2819182 RepID=UPI001BECBA30|nr:TetR/AcrR family transcriptional regulator [Streptomyces sp. ISL-36]MBT2441078.1 TetR/AcrR family transcriptional regulator [Streptomyces sp. ISL-36]
MMQERAARTRSALIQAAALEFEHRGYEGASLSRISESAHTSMGGLTFHFRTKEALADAVCSACRASTARHVAEALTSPEPPIVALGGLVTALVRLLETSVEARAAARLRRERPTSESTGRPEAHAWVPALKLLLARAHAAGDLRADVAPGVAEALIVRLVEGTELSARGRHRWSDEGEGEGAGVGAGAGAGARPDEPSTERVWDLLRYAIVGPENIP